MLVPSHCRLKLIATKAKRVTLKTAMQNRHGNTLRRNALASRTNGATAPTSITTHTVHHVRCGKSRAAQRHTTENRTRTSYRTGSIRTIRINFLAAPPPAAESATRIGNMVQPTPRGSITMASYGWVIAVVICIVASGISNFGLNLQKLALTMKATKSKPTAYYRVVWFCGALAVVSHALA